MTQTWLFLKKEFKANWRTKKLMILLILFIVMGILSPFLAKITPELMTSLLPKNQQIQLPQPTSLDSWGQFFKNTSQFCLLGMVLLYAGTISGEIEHETLIPFITKGLSRWSIVLSKSLYLFILWTLGLAGGTLVNWLYTSYYFQDDKSQQLLAAVAPFWLYGLLFLALTIFSSTLTNHSMQSLLIVGFFYLLSVLLDFVAKISHFNPFQLGSKNLAWLQGTLQIKDFIPGIVICLVSIGLAIGTACLIFRKKRL